MSRIILYHATLPGRLEAADTTPLVERLAYAKRTGLASRREERELSLVGIALALAAVAELRGRPVAPEALCFPAGGKPYIASADAPAFSIAHSGRSVAVAAGEEGELGLDIEHAAGSALAASVRQEWSAREAVVKAMGLGLRAAPEVGLPQPLLAGRACLRGRWYELRPLQLPYACDGWLASGIEPTSLQVVACDPLLALRRHAA